MPVDSLLPLPAADVRDPPHPRMSHAGGAWRDHAAAAGPLVPVADAFPWTLLGAAACLLLAAFGAIVGTALLVHSPTKLARRLGDDAARLGALRAAHPDLVVTARVLSILGGAGTCLFAYFGGWSVPSLLAAGIAIALLIGVCGALPPALAATRAEFIVARGWRPLATLNIVLRFPVLWPARAFARVVLRLARVPEQPTEDRGDIAEDILAAVADTDRGHRLAAEETSWIANIVDLKDLRVSAIMTPRTDIVALTADLTVAEALQQVTATGHSRYPVHAGRVDEVVGLLYAKDVLALVNAGKPLADTKVRDLLRKPLFVPETVAVRDLLRQFKQAKVHLAIVLDEYGGTAGLITVEDILEEIVGDLGEEFDVEDEQLLEVIEERKELEASGRSRITEINAALATELPEHDDYDTIAGYLFSRLGRIPPVGEKAEVDGVEFTVLRGDARRIDRMRLRVLQPERANTAV